MLSPLPEFVCSANDFVQFAQQFALLFNQQLGVTDNIDGRPGFPQIGRFLPGHRR